jgi:uncharacterized protein (TIGR02145 family)
LLDKWKDWRLVGEDGIDEPWVSAGGIEFAVNDSFQNRTGVGYETNTTNEWIHIVGVFHGSQLKLYVNGVLAGSKGIKSRNFNDNSILIGTKNEFHNFYEGVIDEVGLWERPLSEEDITKLYNNGIGLQYPFDNTMIDGETGNFTDSRDGQTYEWVKIGDQVWMAENLAYLPSVNRVEDGSEDNSSGKYYYVWGYDGTDVSEAKATDNYDTYGVLYNWYAAMDGASSSSSNPSNVQGVCPDGWHVPSDEEWKELEMQLGMSQSEVDDNAIWSGTNEGSKLAGNISLWYSGDLKNDPEFGVSGFTALPGGSRDYTGHFYDVGFGGNWWSSTEYSSTSAWSRYLNFGYTDVHRYYFAKDYGFSVRCVRD